MAREAVIQALRGLRTAILSSHVSPDPDAVSSAGALALALRSMGIEVSLYLADKVPDNMLVLAAGLPITHEIPKKAVDAVVVTDTSVRHRIGPDAEALLACGKQSINIDHHVSNPAWADLNFIDATAASSTQIVEGLLRDMALPFTRQIANLLYAGLADDTGSFRFSNTSAAALDCAARLVRVGADPSAVANELYAKVSLRRFNLRIAALQGVKHYFNGQFATISISKELLSSLGALPEDTDGLIDDVRALEGTLVVALMRELDGFWKLSLRSKDPRIDVNKLAERFGGGGHAAAAGCRINGTLPEVESQLTAAVKDVLSTLK